MRKIDTFLTKFLGKRYLPLIWLRAYILGKFMKRIEVVSPISISNRKYDTILRNTFSNNLNLLAQKKPLPTYFGGCNFVGGDLEIYDFFLGTFEPQQIIEIGSGGSTQFAYYKTLNTKITAIDPEPRTIIPSQQNQRVSFIEKKCEDVDLKLFDTLNSNDILFIDSSHLKEEAEYHVNFILPRLKSGVIIHHHDIYYPYDINPGWEEQKVILDFYFDNTNKYEIIFPSAFAYYFNNWIFRTKVNLAKHLPPNNIPSSFWVRKL